MHWIDFKNKSTALAFGVVTLMGCTTANQETILPQPDKTMIDIYREAMDPVDVPPISTLDPVVMCASLTLDEAMSEAACQKALAAHISTAYQRLDTAKKAQPIDYIAYTRTAETELDNLFPRLENPDLVIYVYPHLATRTRAPIPGYTTVIPLYDRVEYRLPGEALLRTPVPSAGTEKTSEEAQP